MLKKTSQLTHKPVVGQSKEFLDKHRHKNRPIKSGVYTKIELDKVDFRTRLGKHLRRIKRDITRDLGGMLSARADIFLDIVVLPQMAILGHFSQQAMKGSEIHDRAWERWRSICNSMRLNLLALFELNKTEAPGEMSLDEYVKKIEAGEIKPDLHNLSKMDEVRKE